MRKSPKRKSLFTPRILSFTQLEDRVVPATFLVSSLLDDGGVDPAPVPVLDGSDNGTGTLRQAIVNANANPGLDTILFDPAVFGSGATISLENILTQITDETKIIGLVDGLNANLVTISGMSNFNIFDTSLAPAGTPILFENLIITQGNAGAAAIGGGLTIADEIVTLKNIDLTQNTADQGGGIRAIGPGTLNIENSRLVGNSSTFLPATITANGGGAIRVTTNTILNISGSLFKANTANNDGGGIYGSGSIATISNTVFIQNRSLLANTTNTTNGGAAIKIVGVSQVEIDNSVITQNTSGSVGGAIYNNNSKLTISNSLISENKAVGSGGFSGRGGGVFNNSAYDFTIFNSQVTGNSTAVLGGALYAGSNPASKMSIVNTTINGNTAGNAGAALHTFAAGSVSVKSSSIYHNTAAANGGGINVNGNLQDLFISNSTFVNNTSAAGGGAIQLASITGFPSLVIQNSTITANTTNSATVTLGDAGGGVVLKAAVPITIDSTIISGNVMAAGGNFHDLSLNVGASLTANHNAIGSKNGHTPVDTTSSPVPGTNLDYGLALLMGPLADNGGVPQGPTGKTVIGKTVEILPGSPALNKGSNISLLDFDQRGPGFPREFPSGSPDIGAFERLPGDPAASGGPYLTIDESNFAAQDPYLFTVTYLGDTNIDVSKLGNTDVRVTNPSIGFDQLAQFVSSAPSMDNPTIVATYKVSAPMGGWTTAQNGKYTISVEPNEVFLAGSSKSVPATTVGSFFVSRDYIVTNTNNDGPGSLRDAILAANDAAGTNTIRFDSSFNTANTIKTTGVLSITDSVNIVGPGADLLTIDAQKLGRVINITDSTRRLEVTISGATITGGSTTAQGGGIFFGDEILNLIDVHLVNNTAGNGGAIGNANVLADPPQINIERSAITGNSATNRGGGIMFYSSQGSLLDIRNSTISGNSANGIGGGFYGFNWNSVNHIINVTNSTVTKNFSATGGGGLRVSATVAPIYNIVSSIVAGNLGAATSPDLQNGTVNSEHSAIGDFTGTTMGSTLNDIFPGTPLLLEPLADNGGSSPTHAFGPGSPLHNAGINPNNEITDQRGPGFPRVVGPQIDIGAYERPEGPPTVIGGPFATVTDATAATLNPYVFTVKYIGDAKINTSTINNNDIRITGPNSFNTLASLVSINPPSNELIVEATYEFTAPGGSWNAADKGLYTISMEADQVFDVDGKAVAAGTIGTFGVVFAGAFVVTNNNDAGAGSLREALTLANIDPNFDEITFDPTFFSTAKTITLTSGELPITEAAKITGPGAGLLTITNASGRAFNITNATYQIQVELSGMTISGNSAAAAGSAIQINNEIVTLDSMVISGNTTSAGGGAIAVSTAGSSLTVLNSAIVNNKSTGTGGGFNINSSATLGNSFVLRNSTVSGNSASGNGGGMFFGNTGAFTSVVIENSTITNNTSAGGGGFSATTTTATANITSSIISGNKGPAGSPDILTFSVNSFASAIGSASGFTSLSSALDLPVGADLKLLALADNGGGTFTHGFKPNSPLRNTGVNFSALSFDQRGPGFPREQPAGLPDIGAFELISDIPFASIDDPLPNVLNDLPGVNNPYTFTVTYFDDDNISRVTIGNLPADDVEIVRIGGGFNVNATFVSADSVVDAPVIKATYKFTPPGGTWNGLDNGTYEIRTLLNGVKNAKGVSVPVETLGSFLVDFPPPSATVTAANVFENNATTNPYKFTVTFSDVAAINASSIINNNNAVRVTGPNGFDVPAQYLSIDVASDGTPRTATYQITPPVNDAAGWDKSDNGTYTIQMQMNQVFNTPDGIAVPQGPIGSFLAAFGGVVIVSNTNDSGIGSLRDAIALTNADPQLNQITFDSTVFSTPQVITLTSGELSIAAPVNIFGPGVDLLTVTAGTASRNFNTTAAPLGTLIQIADMTISGGSSTTGGNILVTDEALTLRSVVVTGGTGSTQGGNINVSNAAGSLALDRVTVSDGKSGQGGGLFINGAKLLIENSTLVNNATTIGNVGGAIRYASSVPADGFIVRNSTFFGNTGGFHGGAIGFSSFTTGNALIENSTISNNTASGTGKGGGIGYNAGTGTVTLVNTIVSGNISLSFPDIPDIGSTVLPQIHSSHSAIGSSNGFTHLSSTNDLPFGTNLKLGTLANNGGPTQTMLPANDSPVVNAGTPTSTLPFDQRGAPFARLVGPAVDIGAVEVQAAAVSVTGFEVNNGAIQRSRLTTITVTFSGPVTPAAFSGLGDIVLTRTAATAAGTVGTIVQTGAAGANGLISVAQPGPSNQLVLTFSNANAANETAGVEYGSLADGRWQLAIPSASFMSTLNDPTLRRLFGDFEAGPPPISNGTVDSSDFGTFGGAFGTSPGVGISPFDYDNNGTIDSTDFAAFGGRFGISV